MGRYIEWDDVVDRYPELNTLGGADELGPAYIDYAESFVDGLLSDKYTVPFSNNNMVIRDLAIDYVYYRAARFKFEDAASVQSAFFGVIAMIKNGDLNMVDTSGEVITGIEKIMGIYSTTESYHTAFGIDDPINWRISSDQMSDVQDSRD